TGQLTAPKFQLFSRPALPDSDVLSYIITGRGFGDVNSDQAGIIARAALSLGAEQGSIVTSQVQDAFGLDEFSVSTGTTAAETSFIAGKRLSPKLSVRSDFNPFDRLWSFFVNYKLTSTWSVEAESGQRQGADLIYSFERDSLLPEGWLE
ncbi:MAG: translocation/assembly module TamB domain-containing protein, partial [Gammaproteobacteria bacterium]